MNVAQLIALLVESGLPAKLAALLGALIDAWVRRLQAEQVDAETLSAAERIIAGIEAGHPDWDGPTKARFAADALMLYVCKQSAAIRQSTANSLVEMTVVATDPATGAGG